MRISRLACLALVLASLPALAAKAQLRCESEQECTVKKPNVLLVLDYSSSMIGAEEAPAWFPDGQTVLTRWGAALDAASYILEYDQGLFARNVRVGLARFAHDPLPKEPATTIRTDRSFPPITDGFAIDVPFDGTNGEYLECKASGVDAALEVLRSTPPPWVQRGFAADTMMLTWTRGALRSAHDLIRRTRASHAGERGEELRDYEVVLLTDGDWTCPDRVGQQCDEDPAVEAAKLREDGIPVHVIAFGDATRQPSLTEVALQGGTARAVDATSPKGIVDALGTVLARIRDGVIVPTCTQKLPRVLITLDASTSMIEGNREGETKWDKARYAIAGNPKAPKPSDPGYVEPVLSRRLTIGGREVAIEDVVHFAMVAFGRADEQKVIANFSPCMRDNFAWALDPRTSCKAPGCSDAYTSGPVTWTFQNSDRDRAPPFVRTTLSHVPPCNAAPGSNSCVGQTPTTFTGQGLEYARRVIADYRRDPKPFKVSAETRFVNVLVTDGQTSEGSSSVEQALKSLVQEGVDTYVIGFGAGSEISPAELDRYAGWGNTGKAILVDPSERGAAGLADALAGVVRSLNLEPCCVLNDCAAQPEPPEPKSVCGDGKIEGNETCDDGAKNATYGHCGGLCDALHLHCGDGRVDDPEECDDGNAAPLDGCDPRCRYEEEDADAAAARADAGRRRNDGRVRTLPEGIDAGAADRGGEADDDDELDRGDAGSGSRGRRSDDGCGVRGGTSHAGTFFWLVTLGLLSLRRRRRTRA